MPGLVEGGVTNERQEASRAPLAPPTAPDPQGRSAPRSPERQVPAARGGEADSAASELAASQVAEQEGRELTMARATTPKGPQPVGRAAVLRAWREIFGIESPRAGP